MPISPLTVAFPLGGIAALIAWALSEKEAEASKGSELTLNGLKWGECPPGYRPKWNADHTSMVCEKIPEFEMQPAAPGEVPKAVPVDAGKPPIVPVSQTKPGEPVPHPSQVEAVPTPSGGTALIVKKPETSQVAQELAKKQKPQAEKPVAEVLAKKEKEEKPSKPAQQAAESAKKKVDKKEKPKKAVTLAQWQADMKKKQTDNNCGPTEKPEFAPFNNEWAEYKCVPASKITVIATGPMPAGSSDVAKVVDAKQKEEKRETKPSVPPSIPQAKPASFEPEAAPFVSEALKSHDYQKIVDSADSMQMDFPRAAAYLRNEAPKYTTIQKPMTFEPEVLTLKEKPKKEKPSKVSKVLESKKEITFEPEVLTLKEKPSKETSVAEVVSKKQWEEDKKYKQSHNNCQEGYEPAFKSYSNDWAAYDCKPSDKVKKGVATLKAEGIEDDMAEKVAIFLSNNPSATDARSLAAYYEGKKPKAAARLRTYAQFQEHLESQKEKGKPTKPEEVAKAVKKTDNPVELMNHAKTLDAQGDKRGAKAVAELAKSEAKKQGKDFLDDKAAAKLL